MCVYTRTYIFPSASSSLITMTFIISFVLLPPPLSIFFFHLQSFLLPLSY